MIIKARDLKKLDETVQALLPLKLKMPFAYDVAHIAKEVHENNTKVSIMRQEIIERYAKRDDNGQIIIKVEDGTVEVDENKYNELDRELNNLFDMEVELASNKIKLNDIKDLDLTVGQIEALIPFIEK